MLDGTQDAGDDVELRRDDLAGLADLPVVRSITGIDGRAACTNGSTELVGQRQDNLIELLRGAKGPTARDDDFGRSQFWTIRGRHGRIGSSTDCFDVCRNAFAGRGSGADRDHLLGVGGLNRQDGVAVIERTLESVS